MADLELLEKQLEEATEETSQVDEEGDGVVFGDTMTDNWNKDYSKVSAVHVSNRFCDRCNEQIQPGDFIRYCKYHDKIWHTDCQETCGRSVRPGDRDGSHHRQRRGRVVEVNA